MAVRGPALPLKANVFTFLKNPTLGWLELSFPVGSLDLDLAADSELVLCISPIVDLPWRCRPVVLSRPACSGSTIL